MSVIGSGQYAYEVDRGWAKLPDGWSFGIVTGVAVNSQDRVYLCQQQQDPPVLVFDHDGRYLNSWGTGTIIDPHTVHIDQDDNMYLCDRGTHMASKMTLDGDPLLELGTRGQPSDTGCTEDSGEVLRSGGPFNMPTRMFPLAFRRALRLRRLLQQPGPPVLHRWGAH